MSNNAGRRSVMGKEQKTPKRVVSKRELKLADELIKDIKSSIHHETFKKERENFKKRTSRVPYLAADREFNRRLNREKGFASADLQYLRIMAKGIKSKMK